MHFDVVTLFPELFSVVTESGVSGRAHQNGLWSLRTWNPRSYTHNVHQTVDDRPYGGGPGMVMLAQPLVDAIKDIRQAEQAAGSQRKPVYLLGPAGRPFDQPTAQQFADGPGITLICGRYEGIDQRLIDKYVDHEISLGDFVLSGGELAALPIIDACVRLLPGALNDARSAIEDSFSNDLTGLLDCEHYTRPPEWQGSKVPEILCSGDHSKIAAWRRQQSLRKTLCNRPDLLHQARHNDQLSRKDLEFLESIDPDWQSR